MIKYEGIEKKYLYNPQDVENILQMLETGKYYRTENCTQEKVAAIVNAVNSFMSNIKVEEQTAMLERHETEEEARAYFGQEFIDKFDRLLTILDKQQTIVALHGTHVGVCPQICENGLQYKTPSLSSTAVQQSMAYGQEDMHYSNYESLLNWEHKNYKGLVIVAVPYECFYKEGLWNHFAQTETSAYGGQDYRIDPDFVVGYIDVEGKNIVINPKYNRQHNYEGYVKDNELFREQLDMDNEKMVQAIIDSEKRLLKDKEETSYNQAEQEGQAEKELDAEKISYVIEDLIGTFNSIKIGFPDGMTESRYKYFLQELSHGFSDIQKALPNLKTDDQVKREQEDFPMFSQTTNNNSSVLSNGNDLDDFDWDENVEWDDGLTAENENIAL